MTDPTHDNATAQFTLRAMGANYSDNHRWDHLDTEAVTKGADEIAALQAALEAATARADKAEAALLTMAANCEVHEHHARLRFEAKVAALSRVTEAKAEGMREAADLADEHEYGRDIDWWRTATKTEISADACRSVAAAIRHRARAALAQSGGADPAQGGGNGE